MKSEDFERLKAICEKEGFEVVTEIPKENDKYYVVKKRERVRVLNPEIIQAILYNDPNLAFRFYCEIPEKKHLPKGVKDFLSSQLEKYLNGEIE